MKLFYLFQDFFEGYNSFFYWRNGAEILFFTIVIYYFSIWLKKDRHKNLLPYFYGYCFLAIVTYHSQLITVSYFLFLFAPVAIMLFILVHQTILQRNFVALQKTSPTKQENSNWEHDLVRSFLLAINKNKEILCVIENKDTLEDFIYAPMILNANIQQGLITLLQDSDLFDQKKMLWLNTNGQLIGINTTWQQSVFQEFADQIKDDINHWKQNALLLSAKTDALFLRITPKTRTFNIIFNGKIINNINSENTLKIIRKYTSTKFYSNDSSIKKGDIIHETFVQKNLFKQRSN